MAGPIFADRVQENSTTTGTGTYTLSGATTGYQAWSVVGNANTAYYMATDGIDWEVGLGTYTLSGTTLARTTIYASSNSNAAVSWSAGTRTISLVDPAPFLASLTGSSPTANFSLTASVGSSALTIALKDANGSDPSVSSPAAFYFRNVTAATGAPTQLWVTAATSLIISSGSTMGFSNATAGRLWIVGFNDSGTFRIGAVNVLSGTSIMPLRNNLLLSSTAEGGGGGADSAQIIYTGTAVSAKAVVILGYMEWASGLTTAGTWAIVPTTVQSFEPGISLPGDVIQTARTDTGTSATGTTVVPSDNTIPQSTEGVQFMTIAITPVSTADLLRVSVSGQFASTVQNDIIMSLFQDSTANALSSSETQLNFTNTPSFLRLDKTILSATTSSTTFKTRAGGVNAGTTTFNGASGSQLLGGVFNSFMQVDEIMA